MTKNADRQLLALADHLDPDLAYRLRRLVAADSEAHRYLEVASRLEFAEDLVAELRRHVTHLDRLVNELRSDQAASTQDVSTAAKEVDL